MQWIRVEGKPGDHQENPRSASDGLGGVVIVLFAAGMLAMVATWFLDAYFPIPNDDDIYLGLIGFLFVLFIVLAFAAWRFSQGRGTAPIKASLGIFLLGLVIAAAVGSLPFLQHKLSDAMPWTQEFPWVPLLALGMCGYGIWARRKTDHVYSRKRLISSILFFVVSASSYLAVSAWQFSAGKIWQGALSLVIAFGFVLVFFYDWRISRRGRGTLPENIA